MYGIVEPIGFIRTTFIFQTQDDSCLERWKQCESLKICQPLIIYTVNYNNVFIIVNK